LTSRGRIPLLFLPIASSKENIMATTLRIGTTKEQLLAVGFVKDDFFYDAHNYQVIHPAGDVRLIFSFRRTDADVFTVPTAPANTPEYDTQKTSPRRLPAITFNFDDSTERIVDMVLAYKDLFLAQK
jgi:hypothetical protein